MENYKEALLFKPSRQVSSIYSDASVFFIRGDDRWDDPL